MVSLNRYQGEYSILVFVIAKDLDELVERIMLLLVSDAIERKG